EREAIIDSLLRLYAGLDSNDHDLFTSAFTNNIEIDLTKVHMGGQPMTTMKGLHENVVPKVLHFLGPFGTSHALSNFRVIKESPDTASVEFTIVAQHWRPGDASEPILPIYYTMSNKYAAKVVRMEGDLWKVQHMQGWSLWALGDPTLL
ncbi:hypothetical protein BKA56DRAFT_434034, partial [Ilyonectria sp. MPI-CAGE-AT-0026]